MKICGFYFSISEALFGLLIFIFLIFNANSNSFASTASAYNQANDGSSAIKAEHKIDATILFHEIHDINLSEGHYKVSAELILSWFDDTSNFVELFGNEVIHGTKLDNFLKKIWFPEFIVSNAENPRITHYSTLEVVDGHFELFERFEADVSVDAEMPSYPFGELDLYLEIAAFSGNTRLMQFVPQQILIGHKDAHHEVVKGNWGVSSTKIEAVERSSLHNGGADKYSYLISHVNVAHNALTATQKVLLPLFAIVFLSLLFNHFLTFDRNLTGRSLLGIADVRMSSQMTLFLTIPALKFALSEDMPTTHYLNFTDGLFLLATVVVAINLTVAVLGHRLTVLEDMSGSETVTKFARFASPTTALFLFILILIWTNQF